MSVIYTDIHGKSHTVKRKEKTAKKTVRKKKSGILDWLGGRAKKAGKAISKTSTKRANKTSRRIWRKLI